MEPWTPSLYFISFSNHYETQSTVLENSQANEFERNRAKLAVKMLVIKLFAIFERRIKKENWPLLIAKGLQNVSFLILRAGAVITNNS